MGLLRWIVWPKMEPCQFGAMARCFTVHTLIEMVHECFCGTGNSRDRNYIHAFLVDYAKGFDRIDPTILLKKLKSFNIPTFRIHWICDFLSDRTQRVNVGDVLLGVLNVWGNQTWSVFIPIND